MSARVAALDADLFGERALPVAARFLDDDRDGAGHQLSQRVRHQRVSFVSRRVECAAWKPPWPATMPTSAPSTCDVDSPRICRMPSARTFQPTRLASESMPPLVLDGSEPPSRRFPSDAKCPASPRLQNP